MNPSAQSAKIIAESLSRKPNNGLPNPHAPPAYTVHPTVEASDIAPALDLVESVGSTMSEDFSPISFTIRTPLTVIGNGNLLALSPPVVASSIAEKIMRELKSSSMTDGIPMIDEHGRPRPIEVIVEAGMDVRGNGNVVGEREVLGIVARNMRRASTNSNVSGEEAQRGKRAASEPLSNTPAAKRERTA